MKSLVRKLENGLQELWIGDLAQKVWRLSDAWDRAHTNKDTVWDEEREQDRLIEALDMHKIGRHRAAFQLWLSLAERGSVWAMTSVGRCYGSGRGVEQDFAQAEVWFKRASDAGSQLGTLDYRELLDRRGAFDECVALFGPLAADDWAPALLWLAWYRVKESRRKATYRRVRPLIERAAERGSPAAGWLFARWMALGRFGLGDIPRGYRLLWELGTWLRPQLVDHLADIEDDGGA